MPLWLRPPAAWPETVDEALAWPEWYGLEVDFIKRFAGSLPDDKRRDYIKTFAAFCWNSYAVPRFFNYLLYQCLLLVLLIGLARRLVSHRLISRLPRPTQRLHTLFAKHVSLAPAVGRSNLSAVPLLARKGWMAKWSTVQVPLRTDAVLLGLFFLGNILCVFTDYNPIFPSIFYPDDPTPLRQNARYLADRSGILALGTTPLVVLLAARNSPLNWLAGVDFGTMQIYHRWVARVTFANVGIHAGAYTWLLLRRQDWDLWVLFDKPYMLFGWVAFLGGLVLCFAAWRRLRQIAYEFFLVGHIIAALGWVIGAYLHVLFLHGGTEYYLRLAYLGAGAWAIDRVLRLASLIWNNTILGRLFRFPSRPSKTRFLAAEGALFGATEDFLRLRITPNTPWARRRGGPGAYVFISSWTTLAHKGWESHPFSIAWPLGVPDPDELDCLEGDGSPTPGSPPMLHTPGTDTSTKLVNLGTSSVVSAPPSPPPNQPSPTPSFPHPFDLSPSTGAFELLIKRYSGFTRALAASLAIPLADLPHDETDDPLVLTPKQLHDLRIAVEGPYGASVEHAVARYRQALLVAGGSGLAMVTSQLADLAVQVLRRACKPPALEVKTERVAVVWSVRESETVHLITPYLTRIYNLLRSSPSFARDHSLDSSPSAGILPSASFPSHASSPSRASSATHRPPAPFLDLHIYVTGTSSSPAEAENTISSLALPPSFLRCTVHSGRPDIGARIDALHGDDEPELLVVSCGPAALCDTAREAVRSRLAGLPSWSFGCAGRGANGDKEELDESEVEAAQGLLQPARVRTRWEASQLVYAEEAVVW
ncbi:hypothetical protein JCM8097_000452 [Rhodosporidiobolus ruineniae]